MKDFLYNVLGVLVGAGIMWALLMMIHVPK